MSDQNIYLEPATHISRTFIEQAEAFGLRAALLSIASVHGIRISPLEVDPTHLPTITLAE